MEGLLSTGPTPSSSNKDEFEEKKIHGNLARREVNLLSVLCDATYPGKLLRGESNRFCMFNYHTTRVVE